MCIIVLGRNGGEEEGRGEQNSSLVVCWDRCPA